MDGITDSMDMGVGDGQGGLVRCDSWGHKESDTNEQLNRTEALGEQKGMTRHIKRK